jgi:Domain of unknown function (DUF1707)
MLDEILTDRLKSCLIDRSNGGPVAVEPLAVQLPPPVRASDEDRERTVAILREHWRAGRLTLAELETRSEEAWSARMVSGLWHAVRELPVPAPVPPARPEVAPGAGAAIAGFVFGVVGMCVLLLSFGLLSFLSLPLSGAGWGVGRSARRSGATGGHRSLAAAGEALGGVGTVLGALAITWWAWVVIAASG